jgi:small conductance mechanosensitive channel
MNFFLANDWDEFQDWLSRSGKDILIIVGLLVAAYIAFRAIFPPVARRAIVGANKDDPELVRRADTIVGVIERSAAFVFMLIGLLTILPEIGVDVTALVAGLGITGLAIALGAQTLVRDGISGVFLLAEDQYRTGDVVNIAGVTGTVEAITLRRTIVRDVDGVVHSVPNGAISVVANYTRDYAAINLPVQVSYGEDLGKVADVVARVGAEMKAHEHLGSKLLEAPALGNVDRVGSDGITVVVTAKVTPEARWEVTNDLKRRLAEAFLASGIHVPYPTVGTLESDATT